MRPFASSDRLNAWLDRWGGILPLLLAEFIVWLGFGALLPVLPLYFTEQGVDLALLGIVIAAWPAARLIGEPIFGWLADRTARVPLMVVGPARDRAVLHPAAGPRPDRSPSSSCAPCAGLSTALYDPAARGYLTDATPPERRGEAFGLYGAAQMGGLLLGPAIGGFGAHWFGGIAFVFVFSGIAAWLAAIPIALRAKETSVRDPPRADARFDPVPARGAVDDPARRGRRHGRSRPGSDPASRPRRARSAMEPRADRGPRHQRRRLLRGRHVRGHLEPVPDRPRSQPRPGRPDVRDVRAAGAAPVALRRAARRSARLARVHRHRLDPAGGDGAGRTRG